MTRENKYDKAVICTNIYEVRFGFTFVTLLYTDTTNPDNLLDQFQFRSVSKTHKIYDTYKTYRSLWRDIWRSKRIFIAGQLHICSCTQ